MHALRSCAATVAALAAFAAAPALAHGYSCAKPYQYAGTVTIAAGTGGNVTQFAPPSGYRLQIEYVSGSVRMATNDTRAAISIGTYAGGTFAWHPLSVGSGYALSDRQTSGEVSLYADAGSLISIEMARASGYTASTVGRFAVSGCLYPVTKV